MEIVLHYKYDLLTKQGGKTTYKTDYDIALVRIDYPAVHDGIGNNI